MAKVGGLVASARGSSLDEGAPEAQRKAAIRLMARKADTRPADIESLGLLLNAQTPSGVQVAVVSRLGALSGTQVPEVLMGGWSRYTPSIRSEVLNVLTTRSDWLMKLVDAIEDKQVSRADLSAGIRQLMITHSDKELRTRAKELLPTSSADRFRVVKAYQPALKLNGDLARGKRVFQSVCIACHKLDGVGVDLGPNLASVTDRNPGSLLSGILDPNASVESKYGSYLASAKDGRSVLGILISENGANITIKDQANQEHVILRSELVSLTNTGRSLMPDGLETSLTQQNLADVIAYVAAAK
jgi:putative heme-binding domain-containing protein